MVLLHGIIQVLTLADGDRGIVFSIATHDRGCIGPALINVDYLGQSVAGNSLGQEPFGRLHITFVSEQEINGLAEFVDGLYR